MERFTSIKNWAIDDRPVEKLLQKGKDTLSNTELLAILINTGTQQKSALDIARDLLQLGECNLLELCKMSIQDMLRVKGIGAKKAVTILAALELGKRRQISEALERSKISSAQDAFQLLVSLFMDVHVEIFYAILLNHQHQVMAIEKISQGGITSTIVDIRVIFKKVLSYPNVTRLIVAHNHPSGQTKPSEADITLTQRIKDAGRLLDIELLDHLIIGHNAYLSFSEKNLL